MASKLSELEQSASPDPIGVVTSLPVGLLTFVPTGVAIFLPLGLLTFVPIGMATFLPIGLATFVPIGLATFLSCVDSPAGLAVKGLDPDDDNNHSGSFISVMKLGDSEAAEEFNDSKALGRPDASLT